MGETSGKFLLTTKMFLVMDLNEEQLKRIRELAELFFSPKDICEILMLDLNECRQYFRTTEHPIERAYKSGHMESTARLRKSIIKVARAGSSPGQTLAIKLLEQCRIDESKY